MGCLSITECFSLSCLDTFISDVFYIYTFSLSLWCVWIIVDFLVLEFCLCLSLAISFYLTQLCFSLRSFSSVSLAFDMSYVHLYFIFSVYVISHFSRVDSQKVIQDISVQARRLFLYSQVFLRQLFGVTRVNSYSGVNSQFNWLCVVSSKSFCNLSVLFLLGYCFLLDSSIFLFIQLRFFVILVSYVLALSFVSNLIIRSLAYL